MRETMFGWNYTDFDWANLLYQAYTIALDSPDPSTQNGAIIYSPEGEIVSSGCNEFPIGVEHDIRYVPERWERPLKYKYVEHAERNSVYAAASLGHSTWGGTMVAPWAACSDCARSIVQAHINRLVRHQQASDASPPHWIEEIAVADQILKEADIEVIDVSWDFNASGFDIEIRRDGKPWRP